MFSRSAGKPWEVAIGNNLDQEKKKLYPPFWEVNDSFFVKTLAPSIQECFVPSLVNSVLFEFGIILIIGIYKNQGKHP